MQWRFGLGVLTGIALSVGGAVWATADGDATTDSVPRVVPYEGLLELDGEAVQGARNMRFALYDTDNATLELDDALWSEEWSTQNTASCSGRDCAVDVRNGRFAVQLGRHVNIMPAIRAADDVCLAIQVRRSGTWHALGGCQQIAPAPFALWSAAGSNPQIAGNLTVDGHVSAGSLGTGAITASTVAATSVTTTGAIDAAGAIRGDTLTAIGLASTATGVRIRTGGGIYQGVTRPSTNDLGLYSSTAARNMRYVTNNARHLFYTDAATNLKGSSIAFEVEANGNVLARNAMTVEGNTRINGVLTFDGRASGNHNVNHGYTGTNSDYTWGSFTNCPSNQYVCGMRQRYDSRGTGKDNWGVVDLEIKCCTFGQ